MASSSFELYIADGRVQEKRGSYVNARICYRWARDAADTIGEQDKAKRLIERLTELIGDHAKR